MTSWPYRASLGNPTDPLVTPHRQGFALWREAPRRPDEPPCLIAPNRLLADGIAAEWRHSGLDTDEAGFGPLGRVAHRILRVADGMTDEIPPRLACQAEHDLLCYPERHAETARDQNGAWRPLLAWCGARFGIALETVEDAVHRDQSASALKAAESVLQSLDPVRLAIAWTMALETTSLVLPLAMLCGRVTGAEAFDLFWLHQGISPAPLGANIAWRERYKMTGRLIGMLPGGFL